MGIVGEVSKQVAKDFLCFVKPPKLHKCGSKARQPKGLLPGAKSGENGLPLNKSFAPIPPFHGDLGHANKSGRRIRELLSQGSIQPVSFIKQSGIDQKAAQLSGGREDAVL